MVTVRKLLVASAVILLLFIAAFSLQRPLLRALPALLVKEQPLERSDAMLILGGEVTNKVDHAAKIYGKLRPSVILVSPTARAADDVGRLAKIHSIPRSLITILPNAGLASSTYEEAVAMRNFLQRSQIRSVTVVTSTFHTRRAYWILRRMVPRTVEIRMSAAPEDGFNESEWWRTESGVVTVNNELIKFIYYWWNYRRSAA